MKYIDSEKLKTELESIYDNMLRRTKVDKDNSDYWEGKADAYRNVIDTITSLQQEQPEVDLEEEANECWDYVFSAIGWDENSLITMNHKEFLAFARHFYELGLKARKK